MNPQEQKLLELENTVKELTAKLETVKRVLSSHQHLGVVMDGSQKFEGKPEGEFTSVTTIGGIPAGSAVVPAQITMVDSGSAFDSKNSGVSIRRRGSGLGIQVALPNTSGEIIHGLNGLQIENDTPVTQKDLTNFEKFNLGSLDFYFNPTMPAALPWGALRAGGTPTINKETSPDGAITNGGSTLTDTTIDIRPNDILVGRQIVLINASSVVIETFPIASNTSTEITIGGTWTSATGSYRYLVTSPFLLGDAVQPWQRLYVGGDPYEGKFIRLGYGASSGTSVIWIASGVGSPEGVVTANVGSLYLRTDGSTSTTLYVKTANTDATGWTAK